MLNMLQDTDGKPATKHDHSPKNRLSNGTILQFTKDMKRAADVFQDSHESTSCYTRFLHENCKRMRIARKARHASPQESNLQTKRAHEANC